MAHLDPNRVYQMDGFTVEANDTQEESTLVDNTGLKGLKARIFNLNTLCVVFSRLAFISELASVVCTLYTSVDAIAMGYLQKRRVFSLDYYRNYVALNYKSWLTIYAAWGSCVVFGAAANFVQRVINRRISKI
ncbi:hypothetical protein PRJ_Dakar_00122 [Faustovirus]|nr:hypothetical protein PRJ_Dakar_00122 [Faustovirus]